MIGTYVWVRRAEMDISMAVSIISAVVAVISVAISIYYNSKSQNQYMKSIEPALSFKLFRNGPYFFLQVANTGQSPAVAIRIEVKEIINNGKKNELHLDKLFGTDFDLYPTEITQGKVALCGETISEHVFPSVTIYVEYKDKNTGKETVLNRTIIYNPSFGETIHAKVDMDLKDIRQDMHSIARSSLRTANYLDGHNLLYIDDFNICSSKSLHNDLKSIFIGGDACLKNDDNE